jgi:hypothetical protein
VFLAKNCPFLRRQTEHLFFTLKRKKERILSIYYFYNFVEQHVLLPDFGGGKSIVGFPAKNPSGLSENPVCSTGMTGKSSGRGICTTPNACQMTSSPDEISRSSFVHSGKPSPSAPWTVNSPAGHLSFGQLYGVTHKFFVANSPFYVTAHSGPVNNVGIAGPLVNGINL